MVIPTSILYEQEVVTWVTKSPATYCSKSKKGNNSFKNTRIKKSKWYAHLQMIRKHHVKFQNDRKNGVGGVTQTRCGTDARTHRRTHAQTHGAHFYIPRSAPRWRGIKKNGHGVMSRRQHPTSETTNQEHTSRGRHKVFNKVENPHHTASPKIVWFILANGFWQFCFYNFLAFASLYLYDQPRPA